MRVKFSLAAEAGVTPGIESEDYALPADINKASIEIWQNSENIEIDANARLHWSRFIYIREILDSFFDAC